MTQRISITPDPPVRGGTATICYDFTDSPHSSVDLGLDYSPDGVADAAVNVTNPPGCAQITIPANATSLIVSDETGDSDQLLVATQPPPTP